MSAKYNGLIFRTSLEARWAAFFDLVGWKWELNPQPINNWAPDFRVTFPCTHSECGGKHTILVSVLNVSSVSDFGKHPCLQYPYGFNENQTALTADAGAAFGNGPSVTYWVMAHGAGGGDENVCEWTEDPFSDWEKAKKLVS